MSVVFGTRGRLSRTVHLSLFTLIAAGVACDERTPTATEQVLADARDRPAARVACDADNGGLTLPPGFCAVIVARDVGHARHMAVRPNGDLFVALANSSDGTVIGGVLALRDTDGDGHADVQQRFATDGGNGIAWRDDGFLYFAKNYQIERFAIAPGSLTPSGPAEVIVGGLPNVGDHRAKTVVLSGQRMFINIGSASNSCQVQNRVDFSPGIDPCPELAVRAGVWDFDANTPGQTQANGVRVATGIRNSNALALSNGRLYGIPNGRDQLFDNWPTFYDARDDALLPGEELIRIEQGLDFGWPYCYYDGIQSKKVLAPEYGGDGKIIGRCASKNLPLASYPAHWAPLSILFYTGSQFPQKYRDGLFIAFHGSRFDPSLQPAGPGYNVVFVPWRNGRPTGAFQSFADGFAGGNPTPTGAAHRPVGLAQAPDGSLYVSDDKGGFIWRISHVDH